MNKLLITGLVMALVGCGGEPTVANEVEEATVVVDDKAIKDTAGYKLTVIETDDTTISPSDPRVTTLNSRLTNLSQKTGMPNDELADMSYYITKEIRGEGKIANVSQMLDVIEIGLNHDSCIEVKDARECLAEYLAMYATVRMATEQTHKETLEGFKGIVEFANDPEKMAQLNELAEQANHK